MWRRERIPGVIPRTPIAGCAGNAVVMRTRLGLSDSVYIKSIPPARSACNFIALFIAVGFQALIPSIYINQNQENDKKSIFKLTSWAVLLLSLSQFRDCLGGD